MSQKYKKLFSPVRVGNVVLKNRIVSGPMNTAYTNHDGTINQRQIAYYMERVRGGVGMLTVEAAPVEWPYGKGGRRQLKMNDPCVTPEWSDLIPSVHAYGCKIICQLNHLGFRANRYVNMNMENVTASAVHKYSQQYPARALTIAEIDALIHKYELCAGIACEAEFDGIEIHAAHEYLFNQFLSPLTNYRTDEYGGSLENRARFLIRTIEAVRKVIGTKKILSVRLPVTDWREDGLTLEEGAKIAKMCEDAGADMISCSTGFSVSPDQCFETEFSPEGQRIHFGTAVKKEVKTAKVGVAGKIRTPEMAERILENGDADLIIMARTMLADPNWPVKAQMGRENEIRKCMSCLECFKMFRPLGANMRCAINPFVGFEWMASENNVPAASHRKNILIIGGGIAGMQAAIIAKKRGHQVELVEKHGYLGGQMLLAGTPPHKEGVITAMQWFADEVNRLEIPVSLNTEADLEYVEMKKPDAVILAIGSVSVRPPVKGMEIAVDAWDVLRNAKDLPEKKNIVVIGGGTVGCETADLLVKSKNKLTVIEMMPELCNGQEASHRGHLLAELEKAGSRLLVNSAVQEVTKESVIYKDSEGKIHEAASDMTIVATGQRPANPEFAGELMAKGIMAYTIGDATATGNFRLATRSAFDIVMAI